MRKLVKPSALKAGDKVATVSLSWGGAGDPEILWRYEQGKRWIQEHLGLEVVEMPHTLKGTDFVYHNPQKRAGDLMQAFADPSVRAIFACIGGDDSIRMLPFIDFDLIARNPKIFTGYSDTTVTHFICYKAGLSSFYGPAILTDFAENGGMHAYTEAAVRRTFFTAEPLGEIATSPDWTGERLEWVAENKDKRRSFQPNDGYRLLQGRGIVRGRLIGGCFEVLEYLKGTALFPALSEFDETIFFLETSEEFSPPWLIEDSLRGYGAMGVLSRISGMIWGKPMCEKYAAEYAAAIQKVLREFGREEMPVIANASFGHNEPKTILPYGALAEINCEKPGFSILESGVL